MCDLERFLSSNPPTRTIRPFDESELDLLAQRKLPPDIVDFLTQRGAATFREDFIFTALPQDHDAALADWGLDPKKCSAFLRTALGSVCYHEKGFIGRLDPITGYAYPGRFEFCDFMNMVATMDAFTESTYFDVYSAKRGDRVLEFDEMFGLVPALPLGGSFETSTLEVVKMREQLGLLAQLFGNKAKKL